MRSGGRGNGRGFIEARSRQASFTTLELKINFLRPVWKAKLRAEARVVGGGKTVGLVGCDVFDPRGRLVARASSTCLRLRGAAAQGRQINEQARYAKANGGDRNPASRRLTLFASKADSIVSSG